MGLHLRSCVEGYCTVHYKRKFAVSDSVIASPIVLSVIVSNKFMPIDANWTNRIPIALSCKSWKLNLLRFFLTSIPRDSVFLFFKAWGVKCLRRKNVGKFIGNIGTFISCLAGIVGYSADSVVCWLMHCSFAPNQGQTTLCCLYVAV